MLNQTSTERKQSRDEARQTIIEHSREYFTSDKSGKGYVCPVCGSGSGEHGTGVTENPEKPNHFTCWRGCFSNADIFEIIGKEYGLGSFADQYNKACEIFGISPDDGGQSVQRPLRKADYTGKTDSPATQTSKNEDYTELFNEAQRHLTETDYHRGITLETLKRYGVGFVPAWRHPNVPANVPASPRLIIPVSRSGYLARDTRKDLTDDQRKYAKQRAGHVGLFNVKALTQSDNPVWITEGEFDALSVIDAGGEAVALSSTTNAGKLIDAVKEHRPKVPLIIALDNDKAGEDTSNKIAEALKQLNFFLYRKKIPDSYKDESEFYMADPEKFREWVKTGTSETLQGVDDNEARERQAFEREAVAYHLEEFMSMVGQNRDRPAISTGFSNLDGILGGGLYAGLYFVGAVTSLGKTTLSLQIADQVAQSGHGILIFSLEMARHELMAKSLSRLTAIESVRQYGSPRWAKTTRGILRGYFTQEEQALILKAIRAYGTFGEHIHITEGVGDVGTATIRAKTEQYIKYTGCAPIIVVDYAQILQAPSRGLTDKQAVDVNVVELKRISRDYDTPVISVSSFNRDNYSAPVNLTSFKESGAIEYSSDVLIGLQFTGMDYQKGEKDTERAQRIRELREKNEEAAKALGSQNIQLKILKNRNGAKGVCYYDFFPAFNYFIERQEQKQEGRTRL